MAFEEVVMLAELSVGLRNMLRWSGGRRTQVPPKETNTNGPGRGGRAGELPHLKDKELIERIDRECEAYFAAQGFMGMAVAVVKDGKVAYFNYGHTQKDGNPIDENTLFEIASLTKVFMGTLLADLSLKGIVSLDTPVKEFFPECLAGEYEGVEMTLRHLATHTSSLPRDPVVLNPLNPFADFSREDMNEFMRLNALRWAPGTRYEYSNLGMGILGECLSDAYGKPYDIMLKELICNKLDMSSTTVFPDGALQARKARPHLASGTPAREWDFDALQAAGGIKSTTRDMIRFLAANLGGLQVDEELSAAMALAQETHFAGDRKVGLGWHIGVTTYGKTLDHNGLVGGYCSTCVICPQTKAGVVVLANNWGSVDKLAYAILNILSSQ